MSHRIIRSALSNVDLLLVATQAELLNFDRLEELRQARRVYLHKDRHPVLKQASKVTKHVCLIDISRCIIKKLTGECVVKTISIATAYICSFI